MGGLRRRKERDGAPQIELGRLVKEVVAQLKVARDTDGDAIMQLDSCDIELGVNVEKEGETGVKVYAFTLGGSVSQTKQSTVTVRFKALPVSHVDGGGTGGAVFFVKRPDRDGGAEFAIPEDDDEHATE